MMPPAAYRRALAEEAGPEEALGRKPKGPWGWVHAYKGICPPWREQACEDRMVPFPFLLLFSRLADWSPRTSTLCCAQCPLEWRAGLKNTSYKTQPSKSRFPSRWHISLMSFLKEAKHLGTGNSDRDDCNPPAGDGPPGPCLMSKSSGLCLEAGSCRLVVLVVG